MSLQILTEVKRKRRRKFTPAKRKINISTKELNLLFTLSMELMVFFKLFRKRKRNSTKKNLPSLRTRNLHGSTLG